MMRTFAGTDDPVPAGARVVTAGVVACPDVYAGRSRLDSYSHASTMGAMSHTDTMRVTPDALGGGVWSTRQDKMTLDAIGATLKPWRHTTPPGVSKSKNVALQWLTGAVMADGLT